MFSKSVAMMLAYAKEITCNDEFYITVGPVTRTVGILT